MTDAEIDRDVEDYNARRDAQQDYLMDLAGEGEDQ